jgi:hypothetical protein
MKHTSLILFSLIAFQSSTLTAKTVEILPEDEVKALLVDAKKYKRNKWRSAAIAGTTFTTGIIIAVFSKRTDIASLPVMGGIITGGYSCWMWWSEKRSIRQAHELAQEHGIEIIDHTSRDDSKKLEDFKNETTQTSD